VLKYFGQELVTGMFGRPIEFSLEMISILVACSLVAGLCSVLYYYLLTEKSMKRQWQILVLVNLVTILSAGWFIPRVGPVGAFASLLIGSLVQLLCYAVLSSHELTRRRL
jgi:O-antigen/teichoic acid export membrane protein